MTQPNRLATLAVRLPAALGPRRYVYAAPNFLNVNFENGEWYIGQGNTQLQPPRVASTMVLADDISIALTDSLGASPDPLVIVAGSQGIHIRPGGIPDLQRGLACWIHPEQLPIPGSVGRDVDRRRLRNRKAV